MALSELQVGEFLAALGERTPSPASGAATALTAACAAALVELAGRFADDEPTVTRAKALAARLTQLADEVVQLAVDVKTRLSSSVAGDAEAAAELARAASRTAHRLAELNSKEP